MKNIGIIAATDVDTRFGVEFVEQHGFIGVGKAISKNPQEQTELQALKKSELTARVIHEITLFSHQVDAAIIYCNSLSGAIDLPLVKNSVKIPIITPLDVYRDIAPHHHIVGLLAANCQSLANIEKVMLKYNPHVKVIGFANLQLVEDIEKGISAEDILAEHELGDVCNNLHHRGAEVIILGCTHFTHIYPALKKHEQLHKDIQLFEPSKIMLKKIRDLHHDHHELHHGDSHD
jgi:glutamate racemase